MTAAEIADRLVAMREEIDDLRGSVQFMSAFMDAEPYVERSIRYRLHAAGVALDSAHDEIRYHVLKAKEDHG